MKLYEKAVALIKERHHCKVARNWDGFTENTRLLKDLTRGLPRIKGPGFYSCEPLFSLAPRPDVAIRLRFNLLHADLTGEFGGWSDVIVTIDPNTMHVDGLIKEYQHQLSDLKHSVTEFLNQEVE